MESLRNKIYDYEVTPPDHCWDKIALDLDNAESGHKFPPALYNMEVAPPAKAWDNINDALHPKITTVVTPIFRRQSPLLKYAAAAILVGLVAFAVIRLVISNNNSFDNTGNTAKNTDTIRSTNSTDAATRIPGTSETNLAGADESFEQNNDLVAAIDPPVKRLNRSLNTNAATQRIRRTVYPETELSQSIYAYEDHVPDISERYVMLMTPDGNFIRMAKKWSELLCCVSGEEQDADCKDQLKKWQQKIATSTMATSPSNFMDILGLVNSLQENTEL